VRLWVWLILPPRPCCCVLVIARSCPCWFGASSVRAGLAQRARIVLLASEGVRNVDIAQRVGVSRPTVNVWRSRMLRPAWRVWSTLIGRADPKTVNQRKIITATLTRRRETRGHPLVVAAVGEPAES
jgi:hypothetical protein